MFSNIFPHMQDWHSESGSDFVAEDFFFFFFFLVTCSQSATGPHGLCQHFLPGGQDLLAALPLFLSVCCCSTV